jgi:hypothetical protein
MREKIVGYRKKYGDHWLTIFPTELDPAGGLEIPWRQLTVQEFLDFDNSFRLQKYTTTEIEDEIFRLAVLNPVYRDNLDKLKSGTISTVVAQILNVSGAQTPEQLAEDLKYARYQVQDFITSAVTLICSVFPAYKPEDLFNLKYETLMIRLAMAEKRLLELGMLQEPLSVLSNGSPAETVAPQRVEPRSQNRQEKIKQKLATIPQPSTTSESSSGKTIIKKQQMAADLDHTSGHDLTDRVLWQHDAVQGLEHIYPEYFKALKEGKKITPELIQATKGRSNKEVEEKHEEYIQKIIKGDIKPEAPKFVIADKLDGAQVQQTQERKKMKVKVRR